MQTFSPVSHAQFARIRLKDFVQEAEVVPLRDWEYLDRRWVGEGSGFTCVLRLEDAPEETKAIELDLVALPHSVQRAMLDAIGLPLRRGMSADHVHMLLGTPIKRYNFVADRTTEEFVCGTPIYTIDCTCLHDGGLIFISVVAGAPWWYNEE